MAEIAAPKKFYLPERSPTSEELSRWQSAEKIERRVVAMSYAVRLQYQNIVLTFSFAEQNKIPLPDEISMADYESRMAKVLSEIERLKDDMSDVRNLHLGVRLNKSDLDIIQPQLPSFGWIIPALIGTVIVVGIIARWAFLEKEVGVISDHYNGVLRRADNELCKDPTSDTCKNWKTTKISGGYIQRETIIDKIKNTVKKIGGIAASGIGGGLMLAIPLLMLLYLPRRRGNQNG